MSLFHIFTPHSRTVHFNIINPYSYRLTKLSLQVLAMTSTSYRPINTLHQVPLLCRHNRTRGSLRSHTPPGFRSFFLQVLVSFAPRISWQSVSQLSPDISGKNKWSGNVNGDILHKFIYCKYKSITDKTNQQ
jgi:hypothetical protein